MNEDEIEATHLGMTIMKSDISKGHRGFHRSTRFGDITSEFFRDINLAICANTKRVSTLVLRESIEDFHFITDSLLTEKRTDVNSARGGW